MPPLERCRWVERGGRPREESEPKARALSRRGIETFEEARKFFRPDPSEGLHDPMGMKDLPAAARRIAEAARTPSTSGAGEKALVYGDYDADGVTSTAMMTRFLRLQGIETSIFVPNRFEHGYGMHPDGLRKAKKEGASLVVALDCGANAREVAGLAEKMGLDLIIGDHHTPPPEENIPEGALAVIDPAREACDYPFETLCACGVGAKIIQGTLQEQGLPEEEAARLVLSEYGDLIATATSADIVDIGGENRVLMREGLKKLREEPSAGLKAIARVGEIDLSEMTCGKIGFSIGPRLNAAGRIEDAGLAARLLLAESEKEALPLARRLEELTSPLR